MVPFEPRNAGTNEDPDTPGTLETTTRNATADHCRIFDFGMIRAWRRVCCLGRYLGRLRVDMCRVLCLDIELHAIDIQGTTKPEHIPRNLAHGS